jgi:ribosomal protein S18 acetylase RimI-like enzyme
VSTGPGQPIGASRRVLGTAVGAREDHFVRWDLRLARQADALQLGRLHAEINVELDNGLAGAGAKVTDQLIAGYEHLWTANLTDESHQTLVAVDDRAIVGFADIDWGINHEAPELLGIYVHEQWRRCGVGSALLSRAKEAAQARQAPALRLWTFENNNQAMRFFEHHGGLNTNNRRSPDRRSALARAGLEFVEYIVPASSTPKKPRRR